MRRGDLHGDAEGSWRPLLLMAVGLVLTLSVVGVTAYAATAPDDRNVSASDPSGRKFGADPNLRVGQRVTVTARGFEPDAPVQVVSFGLSPVAWLTADHAGAATLRFIVPTSAGKGHHKILFAAPTAEPQRTGQPGDLGGNFVVTVPLVDTFRFHVGGADGGTGNGVAGEHAGDGGGVLAHTGVDVLIGLTAAALLLLAGGVATVLARLRRRSARSAD